MPEVSSTPPSELEKGSETHIETKELSLSASTDPYYVSPEDNKRVRRKADMVIMPVFGAIIAIQFLDKTTLTYTSVMGLQSDTKLKGNQYAWLGSIFSLGFLVGQYPMVFCQQRLPLAKFTSVTIIIWGVIVIVTGLCHNWSQLMAVRFLLGVFESSVMPALIMFVAQWYRKQEQGVRTGIYMSFTTWGGILGAGVAYALYKAQFIDRSMTLAAWRVLFYILGALTVLIGIIFGLVIPDTPSKAWFLNEQDREIAVRRTAENMEHMDEKRWNWAQVREALKDPQVLLMLLVSFTTAIPNGGITNFYAIMVLSIGVRIDQGILLSMINCWVSVVTIFVMWYGTRIHKRSIISALPHLISIAGAIMVLEVPKSQSKVRLAGFYLSLVYAVAGTACMSFISSNIAGRTKKSSVAAMYFIVSQVGNLIGPQTFQAKDAKNGYRPALITVVTCNCITFIAMIVLYFYLDRTNKHRDKLAETDQSAVADLHAFGENEVTVLDMTDRQNKHFRYAT